MIHSTDTTAEGFSQAYVDMIVTTTLAQRRQHAHNRRDD